MTSSIWTIDEALTVTSTPGQSVSGSNSNERVLHIPHNSSTPSLLILPGPLWPIVAVPVRVPSVDQIDLFNHWSVGKQITDTKLNC